MLYCTVESSQTFSLEGRITQTGPDAFLWCHQPILSLFPVSWFCLKCWLKLQNTYCLSSGRMFMVLWLSSDNSFNGAWCCVKKKKKLGLNFSCLPDRYRWAQAQEPLGFCTKWMPWGTICMRNPNIQIRKTKKKILELNTWFLTCIINTIQPFQQTHFDQRSVRGSATVRPRCDSSVGVRQDSLNNREALRAVCWHPPF